MRRRPIYVLPLVALLVAAAVLARSATGQGACGPAQAAGWIQMSLTPRADNALIVDAAIDLANPAPIYLEYGNAQVGWFRTPTTEAASSHRLPLVRLRPESSYQARTFVLDASGCPANVAAADFTTGPLPGFMRLYNVGVQGQASVPLTMMDWPTIGPFLPPGAPGDRSRVLAAVDEAGQVVWYYVFPPQYPFPPLEMTGYALAQKPNYNVRYTPVYYSVDEITPDGQLVRHVRSDAPGASWPHHDHVELADGRLLYLGAEDRVVDDTANGGPVDQRLRGDTLHVVDPTGGAVQQVWNAFDTHDPIRRAPQWAGLKVEGAIDWTHANAIGVAPNGSILISIRNYDQIIALSPDFQRVEWRLGGPDSSFTFADPSDSFHGQHGLVVLPNGNLLLFDNGNFRADGEWSRALELALDFGTMTARKVWEYRPQPDIFSDKMGAVFRLPNGNTFVSFGWRELPDEPSMAVEVQPDGTVVWQQALNSVNSRARSVRYRVVPITSLAGETAVQPTVARLP